MKMTPQEALALLAKLAGEAKLSLNEHKIVLRAIEIIGEELGDVKAEPAGDDTPEE